MERPSERMSQEDANELLVAAKDNLRDTLQQLLASGADPREHVFMVIAAEGETTIGVSALAEYAREVVMNDGPASLSDWLEKPLPADHQRVIVVIDGIVYPYAVPMKWSATPGAPSRAN
jgi:hypothetical protein